MTTFSSFNTKTPAEEIVEVLAKHKTPVNLIDSVFDAARSFAYQGAIVQSLREDSKEAASVREKQPVFVPEDSNGQSLNNGYGMMFPN